MALARELRRERATEVEKALWRKLRAKQLGTKFRRQHPLGPYVLDFVSLEVGLVVELDGGQHADPAAAARDRARNQFLQAHGFRVLRFWNNDVIDNLDGVLQTIAAACGDGAPTPAPPPQAGEGSDIGI